MLFSGGGSVNTVSDGSLITKGLPLVQYRLRWSASCLLRISLLSHDPRAAARATPTLQNIQILNIIHRSLIYRNTRYSLQTYSVFSLCTPQTLIEMGQSVQG